MKSLGTWRSLEATLNAVLPVTAGLVLAVFALLLFSATPAMDDFCKASLSYLGQPQSSATQVTLLYFTGWSARWASTFLQSALFSRVDLIASYPWLLLGVMAANLAALWAFFRWVLQMRPVTALAVTAMVYVSWAVSIPSPAENIFWATGATEYQLSQSGILLLVTLLCSSRGRIGAMAAFTLALLVPAQHEVAGMVLCILLAAGVAVARVLKLPSSKWIACLAIATISLAIVVASPAGRERAAQEGKALWDFQHAPSYVALALRNAVDWLIRPIPLLTAVCVPIFAGSMQRRREPLILHPAWLAPLCILGMGLIVCVAAFVGLVSASEPPGRLIGWYLWPFWLLLLCAVYFGIPELQATGALRVKVFQLGLCGILALSLLTSPNFRDAIKDLRGPARPWSKSIAEQLRGGAGTPVDANLPVRPSNVLAPGFADSSPWVTACWVNYINMKR